MPGTIGWSDYFFYASTSSICCNSTTIVGPDSGSAAGVKCYTATGSATYLNGSVFGGYNGPDMYAVPRPAGWADCDINRTIALQSCRSVCKGGWIQWGEDIGEYCGDCGSIVPSCQLSSWIGYGCCGDDPGEYFVNVTRSLSSATGHRCCSNSTDCIDANGNCVPDGTMLDGKICGGCGWMYPSMDGTTSGCCEEPGMCMVHPEGDKNKNASDWYEVEWTPTTLVANGPQCIYPGEFLLDKRCESDSQWGSRTRYISLIMLSTVQSSDDYTLFCDVYNNSFNFYKQLVGSLMLDKAYLMKDGQCLDNYPCLGGHFCVLLDKEGQIKAVGGTLNPDKDGNLNNVGILYQILGLTDVSCDTSTSNNEFKSCGKGLSYNTALNAFIYARDIPTDSAAGIFGTITDFFTSIFQSLFNSYVSIRVSDVAATADLYEHRYPDFNKMYSAKIGNRKILAVMESFGTTERLLANYSGFNIDICEQLRTITKESNANCAYKTGNYYIFGNRTVYRPNPLFDNWPLLTSSLRLTPAVPSCPTYIPPDPTWCSGGTITYRGLDENGCQLAPLCDSSIDATPVDCVEEPLPPCIGGEYVSFMDPDGCIQTICIW